MSEAFDLEFDDLSSAEDFLDYFDVPYEPAVVQVNRLHILQRFHDYLADAGALPSDEAELRDRYHDLLVAAYGDFVASDARTEKVFRVFRMQDPQTHIVPVAELRKRAP